MSTSDNSVDLSDRHVLVTGASRGIGAAIARRFGRLGASVAVNYCNSEDRATEVVDAIRETPGTATAIRADVSEPDQAATLVERSVEALGRLDTVVNSAGVCEPARIGELGDEAIDEVVDTNLKGAISSAASRCRTSRR
ncbi:MAG: SDR family NAD(P)-dependent oxidoreductase, partial [Bradymonadaceae bacterium]